MNNNQIHPYPVFLNLCGKCIIVIGGGRVAQRKVAGLMPTGADIRIISPDFTPELSLWGDQGKVTLIKRRYQSGDLASAQLAFTATNQTEVNQAVAKEAKTEKIWLNVADQCVPGDFWVPACLFNPNVAVAVSAYGKNPGLAVNIRNRIRSFLERDPLKQNPKNTKPK